ncbi:tRNA lysidine(34) synthetase TilS [Bartonella alsatica]|uniref:tRNA(Ile)-lysidine synthase n=2 Tax=Bartonella alsatica TaxID=52764 RepID=J0PW43_9HYPH|nr:tRNA lysidine(34) synthetase TilS [Bartonella alsatica]EJF74374.1 tRNA(Ile)-lysidine synthase [Bartonella alsatica IBS 382]QLC51894.1 tRNA lysidine(34) synthetase TilS [Bartonella alsatica]
MCVRLAGNLFKTSDFIQCQKLILAVSGGSDSLALLFLVKDYLKTLSLPPEIIAVTIDHQLREESAREAGNVAEICHAHDIKHVIVQWVGKKPKTHITSSARIARYDLLFKEAQKQGASLIMTGHTLNDQVETYQMRYQRLSKSRNVLQAEAFVGVGDGVSSIEARENIEQANSVVAEKNYGMMYARGLSCISREAVLRQKIRLIRPLLAVNRKTLRAYLCLKGKTWIDDPTNEDCNFERVRVRQSLHHKKFASIAQMVHEATLQRRQQARVIADLILALDIVVEYGRCFIAKPAPFLQQHSSFPFVVGLFAVLMGGGRYLLSAKKLLSLFQRLCFHSSEKQRFTFAGSVIEYNKSGISLWRESRNMKEALIAPGKTFLWDGRYQITNCGANAIKVGAAGLKQLKSLFQNTHFVLDSPHFPSLQSLLMISTDKGYDIPELTSQAVFHQNIIVKRIMAPFDWLFLREDAALVNVVEPFFNIEVKR